MSIYINNAKWTASDATTPSLILSQPTMGLVDGATYKVYITTTNTVFAASDTYVGVQLGGGDKRTIRANEVWNAAKPLYLVCGDTISAGLEISAVNATAGDTMTIDNVSVIVEQMKPSTNLDSVFVTNTQTVNAETDIGPIDEYAANGVYNGQTKYTSVGTHPDGAGGSAETWDLWWDNTTDWIISPAAGTKGSNHWKLTAASPIGTFTVVGDVTGTGEVTYGPTDHSTATGSPAMKTNGITGYIDLHTSWNKLNDLRDGKFGIVSVYNVTSGNPNFNRVYTAEDGSDGYRNTLRDVSDTMLSEWNGSTGFSSQNNTVTFDELHCYADIFDVVGSKVFTLANGDLLHTDSSVAGLAAGSSTTIRLGGAASGAHFTKAKFAFTAILDLTSVTTVNETWSTGLSAAINTAAENSNYNPHAIAAAMKAYINLTGTADFVYYALDEAHSSNMSNNYGLAYDQDGTAKTSDFYWMSSPSGVSAASLLGGGGYRPRYGPSGYRRRRR